MTRRERHAWECLARGLSTKEIAREMEISVRTVETHLTRLYQELGVTSRTLAALAYRQRGGK